MCTGTAKQSSSPLHKHISGSKSDQPGTASSPTAQDASLPGAPAPTPRNAFSLLTVGTTWDEPQTPAAGVAAWSDAESPEPTPVPFSTFMSRLHPKTNTKPRASTAKATAGPDVPDSAAQAADKATPQTSSKPAAQLASKMLMTPGSAVDQAIAKGSAERIVQSSSHATAMPSATATAAPAADSPKPSAISSDELVSSVAAATRQSERPCSAQKAATAEVVTAPSALNISQSLAAVASSPQQARCTASDADGSSNVKEQQVLTGQHQAAAAPAEQVPSHLQPSDTAEASDVVENECHRRPEQGRQWEIGA